MPLGPGQGASVGGIALVTGAYAIAERAIGKKEQDRSVARGHSPGQLAQVLAAAQGDRIRKGEGAVGPRPSRVLDLDVAVGQVRRGQQKIHAAVFAVGHLGAHIVVVGQFRNSLLFQRLAHDGVAALGVDADPSVGAANPLCDVRQAALSGLGRSQHLGVFIETPLHATRVRTMDRDHASAAHADVHQEPLVSSDQSAS